jgi:hypothetical protein
MKSMRSWRRAAGTLLIAIPLLVLLALLPLCVLLGSLGMDIHFTSKAAAYIGISCFMVAMCGCVFAGIRLRRT